MEEEGCKQQVGLLHALFINIQMTKILADFRKTFHILWKHSATLSWRGKDGTVPSRDAAGWGEATLGSEPHDLSFGTAFATLKLYGLGEDKFSGLHIHMPLHPARLRFSILAMGYCGLSSPLPRKGPRDALSVAAPSNLQMFRVGWICQCQAATAKGTELRTCVTAIEGV